MRRSALRIASDPRRTRRRGLAAAVALVCLIGQLSATFHLLAAQHVRCVEHGEWVHAGHGHPPTAAAVRAPDVLNTPALSSTTASHQHGHEHCPICTERREEAILPPPHGDLRPPVAARCATALARFATIDQSLIYALAPKTSPPTSLPS